MRRWLPSFLCLCWLVPASRAQNRPLRIDDATLLETGKVRLEAGFEFLQNQRYSLSGLEGDLTRAGVTGIHLGVGEYAELQFRWVIQDFLSISRRIPPTVPPDFAGNSTSDFGNLMVGTKVKLLEEKGKRPALAVRFTVELPNTSQASGLGKDETDFYGELLFTRNLHRFKLSGLLGLGILGSPVQAGRQADVLTYGAGISFPLGRAVSLVAECTGRKGPSPERVGNEDQAQVRAGAQVRMGNVRWDVGGIAGLHSLDADSGIAIGITYEFKAFHK